MLEDMKVNITLISSTSYMECEQIPLVEFITFHNKLVKQYNSMNEVKGGSK